MDVRQETDVQTAVVCARQLQLEINTQSGGHSYEVGFATNGILVFMSNYNDLNDVKFVVDSSNKWGVPYATFQSGARNARVHGSLHLAQKDPLLNPNDDRFVASSGTYIDVGTTGHGMCGGYGTWGRKLGLLSDQTIGYRVVNADAQIIEANEKSTDPYGKEIFWALRGGCSGAFGIVLETTVRLHQLTKSLGQLNYLEAYVTHIVFPIPLNKETEAMNWVINHAPFLPDEASVVYNVVNRDVVANFMGDRAAALASVWNPPSGHGFIGLSQLMGLTDAVGMSCFYEKRIQESTFKSFNSTNFAQMIGVTGKTFEGSRYYMLSMVFTKTLPIEASRIMNDFLRTGVAKSLAIKARNGANSRGLPINTPNTAGEATVYTDDAFGPMVRGILFDVHIGVSSPSPDLDEYYVSVLNNIKKSMALYDAGDLAYPGYMYFGTDAEPDYFGAANKQRLIDLRMKVDPDNIFTSRPAAFMYPVPSDPIPVKFPTPNPNAVVTHKPTLPYVGGNPRDGSVKFNEIGSPSSESTIVSTALVGILVAFAVLLRRGGNE